MGEESASSLFNIIEYLFEDFKIGWLTIFEVRKNNPYNEVAIKLGIIFSSSSLIFPSSAKSPRESCLRVPKFCMGS
jgi:hypothetical protein